MWYVFFIVGGVWFWTLAIIELIFLSIFVQNEDEWFAFYSLIVFVLLISLFGDAKILAYIKNNPFDVVRLGVLYTIIGFGWGIAKYFYVSKRVANKIDSIKYDFNNDLENITKAHNKHKIGEKTEQVDPENVWKTYLKSELDYEDKKQLDFYHQGTRIVFWMAYWPISLFWTLFTDILRNFAEWCYETFLINIFKKVHEATIGKAARFED